MANLPLPSGTGESYDEDVDMGDDAIVLNYESGGIDNISPTPELGPTRSDQCRLIVRRNYRTDGDGHRQDIEMPHDNPCPSAHVRLTKKHRHSADDYDRDRDSNNSGTVRGDLRKTYNSYRGNRRPEDVPSQTHPASYGRSSHQLRDVPRPPSKLDISRDLERSLEEANTRNRELLKHISNLEDSCQQLKRRNDTMQTARDLQEELLGHQQPDSTLSAQFYAIFSQIKSWTGKFCCEATRPMDISDVDERQAKIVSRIMPSVESLEDLQRELPPNNIRRRRKFVRGWIALNVAETMFRSLPAPGHTIPTGCDVWLSSGPRDAIETLEFTLMHSGDTVSRSAFHEWRALTFGLLDKMCPTERWPSETLAYIKEMAHYTVALIKSLAPLEANLVELENRLAFNVFKPAAELSQVLRRQRACWYVRFPYLTLSSTVPQNNYVKPCVFDPDFMKDIDASDDDDDEDLSPDQCLKIVDIVITPSLFKSGNHDGEQYDIEFPVEKAEVSCRTSP